MFEIWRIGILLIAWFSMTGAVNFYMVTFPNQVRPGMTFDVQFNLLQDHFNIKAKATVYRDELVVASDKTTIASDESTETITLQIPFGAISGSYSLEISGQRKGNIVFKNSTSLQFTAKSLSTFVQTDKAIYRPGQLVQFRAFSVDPDLNVLNGDKDVGIFDPEGNKMSQWLKVPTQQGLFQNSMQLSNNPLLGDWKIEVDFKGQSKSKVFSVEEYVLPRFEVIVELPFFGLSTYKYLTGKVTAKYTFGEGVTGTGLLTISRPGSKTKFTLIFNIVEEYKIEIDIKDLENVFGSPLLTTLNVFADVKESLTDESMTNDGTITFYNYREKLEFASNFPNNFKPGLKFVGYLLLTDQADQPITDADKKVEVNITIYKYASKPPSEGKVGVWVPPEPDNVGMSEKQLPTKYLPVDNRGVIKLKVDLGFKVQRVDISASYKTSTIQRTLQKFMTTSGNSIQVELQSKFPKAGRKARFTIRSTVKNLLITFLLISKGAVVHSDQFRMPKKRMEVRVPLTTAMTPSCHCVVYTTRPDAEILADSLQFNVDGMFRNQVKLKFSRKQVKPGKLVTIVAKADPGSVVSMTSIDKSVLLLKTGNDVTRDDVKTELQKYVSDTVPVPRGCGGFRCFFPAPAPGMDPHGIFEGSGVGVMTDAFLYRQDRFRHPIFSKEMMQFDDKAAMPPPGDEGGGRVRTLFPETWIYDNVDAGSKFKSKVPDTITSWITTAFALNNETGLGVTAGPTSLTVFLDFFIDLRLPFSIVRGEQVLLKCNIFNFFDEKLSVKVTLKKSSDFDNVIVKQDKPNKGSLIKDSKTIIRDIVVPTKSAVAVYFPIIPKTLGVVDIRIDAVSDEARDAVIKQLLVEPEGIPQDYNIPVLIDLRETNKFQTTLSIVFPKTTVPGSERIRIAVIGDLMGPTISGLDKLLTVPSGCGEQNMITLVPNIFVLKYLTAINNVNPTTKTKAEGNMQQGYQRELTFRHSDGSFSAFGIRDPSGSTWLSAFVVKSFAQASPFIYIDPGVIRKTLDWLLKQFQTKSGLFNEPGRVIHKEMLGGSATGSRNLATYVLIALLEVQTFGFQASDPNLLADVIVGAESSLEDAVDAGMTDTYQLAIGGYALALSASNKVNKLLNKLDNKAIDKDGMRHWEGDSDVPVDEGDFKRPIPKASSNSIEMTAYVLLTYAKVNDIPNGLKVIRWLVKQRNPYGGFGSTQDTVVALQALATFSELIYSPKFKMQIKTDVTPDSPAFSHTFFINKDNAMVLQTKDAPGKTTSIDVAATGKGLALFEVAVFYHVKKVPIKPFFDMDVSFSDENLHGFKLKVCFRWLGKGTSGMVVMEIAFLSGFKSNKFTVSELEHLTKVEQNTKSINLYLNEVDADKVCVSMKMQRDGLVVGSQPAPIRLYSYYDIEKQVSTLYQPKLLGNSNFCDIAGKELGC